jgi:hypothetical protein
MRADPIRALGGYRFDQAEDYDLWLRVADRYRLANLRDPVIRYRRHTGQFSVERLERQALGMLVAQAAARRRTRNAGDGLSPRTHIDRSVAHALGVSDRQIDRAVELDRLRIAAALVEAGDLDSAVGLVGDRATSRTTLFRARERLRARNRLGAARLLARAVLSRPRETLRILLRR